MSSVTISSRTSMASIRGRSCHGRCFGIRLDACGGVLPTAPTTYVPVVQLRFACGTLAIMTERDRCATSSLTLTQNHRGVFGGCNIANLGIDGCIAIIGLSASMRPLGRRFFFSFQCTPGEQANPISPVGLLGDGRLRPHRRGRTSGRDAPHLRFALD